MSAAGRSPQLRTAIDRQFARQVKRWPAPLRADGDALPDRLGIERFGRFAHLAPLIDLPSFTGLRGRLPALRTAHLAACYWGLTRDRVADGQAAPVGAPVLARLLADWRAALADALDDPTRAAATVNGCVRQLARGLALERVHRALPRLTFTQWEAAVSARVAWFWASTVARLGPERGAPFAAGCRLLMLSLQALDDAADAAEDEARFGASVPTRLGVGSEVLEVLSVRYARRASRHLTEAGFSKLGRWCEARAAEVARSLSPERQALGALALLGLG